MKTKHVWWSATALVVAAAVGGTAALGVTLQREYGDLSHGEAQAVQAPEEPLRTAEPGEADLDALSAKLDELSKNKDLATFGGEVIDTETGDVVWQRDADKRLTPASSTKVLTTAAATLALDENEKITTRSTAVRMRRTWSSRLRVMYG